MVCAIAVWKVFQDYHSLPQVVTVDDLTVSTVVLDRQDRLLRAFSSRDDKWRLPVEIEDIDPLYFDMLLAFEDQRFREHNGVDALALIRSGLQSLRAGRIVSGGSTLTMQVARLLDERPTRTLARKYGQILKAVQLEQTLSKKEILSLYILRAPYGGNLEGIRAASLIWFGKEPRRLTPAEAALLVALPQSPEARRPDKFPKTAQEARNRVLARAQVAGVLSHEAARSATAEPIRARRHKMPFHAAHESRHVRSTAPERSIHRLTLDRDLQGKLERLVKRQIKSHPAPVSVAVMVADHKTGDVLASIGSPDLLDETRLGHVDMTRAVRSPGSTLKPFIYGLAFEEGIGTPESLIVDRPVEIAGYKPTNFDMAYQGTVSLREALTLSLNTPAVQLLEAVGPARLMARLKRASAKPVLTSRVAPGLAIGLGGVGMSLRDLVAAYAALARQGIALKLCVDRDQCDRTAQSKSARLPVLSERAAWQVGDILTGLPQTSKARSNNIAYKTGTAYGYRDAWAVGFDGLHVVGVWVGRPDGSPAPGQTGATVAVPILFEAFQSIGPERVLLAGAPGKADSGGAGRELPQALRYARVANRPTGRGSDQNLSITYPPQGAEILLVETDSVDETVLVVKVAGGTRPYRLIANGIPVSRSQLAKQFAWKAPTTGFTDLTVLDALGRSSSVSIRLTSSR